MSRRSREGSNVEGVSKRYLLHMGLGLRTPRPITPISALTPPPLRESFIRFTYKTLPRSLLSLLSSLLSLLPSTLKTPHVFMMFVTFLVALPLLPSIEPKVTDVTLYRPPILHAKPNPRNSVTHSEYARQGNFKSKVPKVHDLRKESLRKES